MYKQTQANFNSAIDLVRHQCDIMLVSIVVAAIIILVIWFYHYYRSLKKTDAILSFLRMVPTSTIYTKLENIQLFYSLILQKQLYDQDSKVKNLMNNTIAIQSYMSQSLSQKNQSFYQNIVMLRNAVPQDEAIVALKNRRHRSRKPAMITWFQKMLVSLLRMKRFLLLLLFCGVFRLLFFYNDVVFEALTSFNDKLSFTRFYLVEINSLPRIYDYRMLSSDSDMGSEAQNIINYRKQILKNLYVYINELNEAESRFQSAHIRNIMGLFTKNMTELLNNQIFGSTFYIKTIQGSEFTNTEFHNELLLAAGKFTDRLEIYYADILPIAQRGLKYAIISNLNNCDFLLKKADSQGYKVDKQLHEQIEQVNHKLIPVIYWGLELIFDELTEALGSSSWVYLVVMLVVLGALSVSVCFILLKFYRFLKTDAAEETYIENNMLNLIDSTTLEEIDEKFSKATTQINFFIVVF